MSFIGERMFTRYTFPFELSALLLTVATIGATILGRRDDAPPDDEDDPVVAAAGDGAPDDATELAADDAAAGAPASPADTTAADREG